VEGMRRIPIEGVSHHPETGAHHGETHIRSQPKNEQSK
jgi:hypothetical protein